MCRQIFIAFCDFFPVNFGFALLYSCDMEYLDRWACMFEVVFVYDLCWFESESDV